ncbi:MAG: hypothetical protein H7326_04380 [Bdellovibrionaceae bacterium]|nr:hypothetical protein [Pseudobdellovibrionaceae bacterium]
MKLKLVLSTLVFSVLAHTANAEEAKQGGLFIEPSVTYQSGEMKVVYPNNLLSESTEKTTGLGVGLRLGFHAFDTVIIAADGRYAKPNYESSALGGSAPADMSNLGVTLGLQTPLAGVRVWGTYLVSGSLDPQDIRGTDVKFNNPKGYRVGAGVYVAMVSVNLEYQDVKYDSITAEKWGFVGNFNDVKGTDKSYILSVSFPIAL